MTKTELQTLATTLTLIASRVSIKEQMWGTYYRICFDWPHADLAVYVNVRQATSEGEVYVAWQEDSETVQEAMHQCGIEYNHREVNPKADKAIVNPDATFHIEKAEPLLNFLDIMFDKFGQPTRKD